MQRYDVYLITYNSRNYLKLIAISDQYVTEVRSTIVEII